MPNTDLLRIYHGNSATLNTNVTKRNGDMYVTTDNSHIIFHLGGNDYEINAVEAHHTQASLTFGSKSFDGRSATSLTLDDLLPTPSQGEHALIPIDYIPPAALERIYVGSAGQTLQQILASGNVQAGDIIRLTTSGGAAGTMYVVQEGANNQLSGVEFVAGTASVAAEAEQLQHTLTITVGGNATNIAQWRGTTDATLDIPNAAADKSYGLITNGAQVIAGVKTFTSTIVGSIDGNATTATTATTANAVAGQLKLRTSTAHLTPQDSDYTVWKGADNITLDLFSSGTNGKPGLTPAGPSDATASTKFLRGDGTWVVPTNTTYTNGTGIDLNTTTNAFSLATVSGITAGSYGPSNDVTGNHGQTISVPYITIDQYGRVTGITTHTYTSVDNNTNTTYSADEDSLTLQNGVFSMQDLSASAISPLSPDTYGPTADVSNISSGGQVSIQIPQITVDKFGRVVGITTKTLTHKDNNTTYGVVSGGALIKSSDNFDMNTLHTITSPATTIVHGPTQNVTGNDNATISVPQVTIDKYGRVTSLTSYTFTAKNTDTTYTASGVLSISSGNDITHNKPSSSFTSGSSGPSADVTYTGSARQSILVPYYSYDVYGHITESGNKTLTLDPVPVTQTLTEGTQCAVVAGTAIYSGIAWGTW